MSRTKTCLGNLGKRQFEQHSDFVTSIDESAICSRPSWVWNPWAKRCLFLALSVMQRNIIRAIQRQASLYSALCWIDIVSLFLHFSRMTLGLWRSLLRLAWHRSTCGRWWVIAFPTLVFFSSSFLHLLNCLCLNLWVFSLLHVLPSSPILLGMSEWLCGAQLPAGAKAPQPGTWRTTCQEPLMWKPLR